MTATFFINRYWLAIAWVALLLSACSSAETPVEKAQKSNILLIGNGSECSRLDPQLAFHASERQIQMAIFETLVTLGPTPELDILPGLAQWWSISADGLTYTFHIQPEARWSDGSPLTSEDAAFAFERLLSPKLGSVLAWFAYEIVGAEAFNQGKTDDFSTVGVKTPDSKTLVITLRYPAQHFLRLMAYAAFAPLPKACIEKYGKIDDGQNHWDTLDHIITSGPFYPRSWHLHESLHVEKNPYYWDKDHVKLNGITFFPIVDGRTEEQAFRNGQIHITYGLPTHRVPYYQEHEPKLLHIDYEHSATELYLINTQKSPLDDVRVRRALNLALDRDALAGLFPDKRKPAQGFVPPWIPNYNSPEGLLPYDLDAARALLAEAGYPGGANCPPIELAFSAGMPYKPVAEALQQAWEKTLGLDVHIAQTDSKTHFYKIMQGDFELARLVWRVECADAGLILGFFEGNWARNPTHWDNDAFDSYLAKSFTEKDPTERLHLLQAAETLLMESSPLIPLFYQPDAYLQSPIVHGWEIRGASYIPYKDVSF